MVRFRYYVADVINGVLGGTDSREIAESYAVMEADAFVVDTETGNWLMNSDDDTIVDVPVEEIESDAGGTGDDEGGEVN